MIVHCERQGSGRDESEQVFEPWMNDLDHFGPSEFQVFDYFIWAVDFGVGAFHFALFRVFIFLCAFVYFVISSQFILNSIV